MKLFLDENLSPRTALRLRDLFPASTSVEALGMRGATDLTLFEYAGRHGYVLVSKDNDFCDLSVVRGLPPKVVWLRVGNAQPMEIETLLRRESDRLRAFAEHPEESLLVLELH